jgi:hypothetical protein
VIAPTYLIFTAGLGLGCTLTLIILGLWIIATGQPVEDDADQIPEGDWPNVPTLGRVGRVSSFDHDRSNKL